MAGELRFRIRDERKEVRDLVIAAIKKSVHIPSAVSRFTVEALIWFNGLSHKNFTDLFPCGTEAIGDTSRQDHIVRSFDDASELLSKMEKNLPARLRVGFLSKMRGVLGVPKELAGFAEFRKSDSLADIRKLAMKSCGAAANSSDCDEVRRKELGDLRLKLFEVGVFDDIARISGLDKRHKMQ